MPKQARDVSGGSQVWGSMIPGYGLASYLLGIFSVPIETFLRRDFGERYYTKANFIAGLVLLLLFRFFTDFLSLFNPMNWIRRGDQAEPTNWLGSIIMWYVLLGIAHFATIWLRDVTDTARHSFDSGTSWLRIAGRGTIWIMNLIAGFFVRIIALALPAQYREKLLNTLPIFRDVNTFTERFIEPFFVLIVMLYAAAKGQAAVSMWLALSFSALNLVTGRRHAQERAYVLDIRDQVIESKAWQEIMEGKQTKRAERLQRTFNETMNEVEKSPEILETIREDQPTIARAISAVRARQNKAALPNEADSSSHIVEAL